MKNNFGSGDFGKWINDEYDMPAYQYTCNQYQIPEKLPLTGKDSIWGDYRNHFSQIGNDRIIGLISNFGYIKIRQDEGGVKFLNDYNKENNQYAGGFGYFTVGEDCLSTFYQEQENFIRQFGCGYYLKKTWNEKYDVEQVVYAPFGDDPCLISKVTIKNNSNEFINGKWFEYWGNEVYQHTYRPVKYCHLNKKKMDTVYHFRREFTKNFSRKYAEHKNGAVVNYQFNGYSYPERTDYYPSIQEVNDFIAPNVGDKSNYEDLNIPTMFVHCLTENENTKAIFNGTDFFKNQDMLKPTGVFSNDINETEYDALILLTEFALAPGETKELYYLIGYLPEGVKMDNLVAKYSIERNRLLKTTMEHWSNDLTTLEILNNNEESWLLREIKWHNYYLRSSLTYDQALGNHVLSQGGVYQYIQGHQCGTRDVLQHVAPFIYSNPEIAKEILDYCLKMVDETGWIYDGITGNGVISDDDPREDNKHGSVFFSQFIENQKENEYGKRVDNKVPVEQRFDDEELWLFWLVSEYILATKDFDYLTEIKIGYFITNNRPRTVLEILIKCFDYIKNEIGLGKNGLIRLLWCDWSRVLFHKNYREISKEDKRNAPKIAESVFTSSLAVYCCESFVKILNEIGNHEKEKEVQKFTSDLKISLQQIWNGKWMPRAWISDEYGFVGDRNEFLMEGQPWTLVSKSLPDEEAKILIKNIKEIVMDSSSIGAAKQHLAPHIDEKSIDGWVWWSLNGPLIWGIVPYDHELAYKEYMKNSLAVHADHYPYVWFGIWSAGDNYTSFLSEYPGYTRWEANILEEKKRALEGDLIDHETPCALNFPVGNLHAHAWPLYDIFKLLQLEFSGAGVKMTPSIPREEYKIKSKLIGFEREKDKISGYYYPVVPGEYTIEVDVKNLNMVFKKLVVNGESIEIDYNSTTITFRGKADRKLEWCLM